MSAKRIFFAITIIALCTLSCQALASAIASPTPPPSSTAIPTDTLEPSPTITPTPPPGQAISPDTVLKIPGMASMVGSGTCQFSTGAEPGENIVQIDGTIPVVDGQYCPCCVDQITMTADMMVPLGLFMPKNPPQPVGPAGASMQVESIEMNASSLTWTNTEDPSTYILSGPKGAKLEKVGDGFLLLEGAAYFIEGDLESSTTLPDPVSSPTPQPTFTHTPEPGRIYEPQGGFSYVPPEGWKVTQAPGFDYKVASGIPTGDFAPNLYFFVNKAQSGSLDEFVTGSLEHNQTILEKIKIISQEDFLTDEGKRGVRVIDENTQRNIRLRQTSYYFEAGARKFVATYTRLADKGQNNDVLIDQSMKTFRPEAASGPSSQPSTVRLLDKAEAQKALEEQDIETLGQKAVEQYSQEEYDRVSMGGGKLTFTIYLTKSEPIIWSMGWCSTTEEILAQNFDHLRYTFSLDGQEVPTDQFVYYEYYSENMQGYCFLYRTVLTDWAPGEHIVQTVTTMDQQINDGWADYAAGKRTYQYQVVLSSEN